MQSEAELIEPVRRFIAREVTPRVEALEAASDAPSDLVEAMRELGLFGLVVPAEFGGLGLPLAAAATIMEAVAEGWTTLAAYLNSHATACYLITRFGTPAQKDCYLANLASGLLRAALTLTEPEAGSDLKAIRTIARREANAYRVSGSKVFVTNGRSAGLLVALVKTDPVAKPPQHGMSLLLIEKSGPGVQIGKDFDKMAYGHVDTCEINFADALVPADNLLGGEEGRGLSMLLDGLELGRIMIAASAVGLAQSALVQAVSYARTRKTFGKPIADHQAIQLELAGMATKIEAARQLTLAAAREKERVGRSDMLSAMAKLTASEMALEVATSAVRIHGGYGYIKGFAAERLFREAPLYVVGEGTNEIQKLVIARRLLETMP